MFYAKGQIVSVDDGKSIKGAFGFVDALAVKIQREPGSEYTQTIMVADTPGNRAGLKPGIMFDAPCIVEAGVYENKPYVKARSAFEAK